MTPVSLGDSVYLHFGTSSASTGAATNADSTPVVTIEEDGASLVYAPTVTNVATGLYRVQIDATGGNGFEAGRRYSVYVTATVGSVAGRDGIGEFEVLATDLNTALDAAISSRLATAGYTAPLDATGTRAALGLAAADLDDQLSAIDAAATLILVDTTAIKAKTDSLTFTVAGVLDGNVQYVKDTAVTGSGTEGDPWGP